MARRHAAASSAGLTLAPDDEGPDGFAHVYEAVRKESQHVDVQVFEAWAPYDDEGNEELLGDFNTSSEDSRVISRAIASNFVHDLAVEWSDSPRGPTPTFRREGVERDMDGTRIDLVLANRPGAHTVEHLEYMWDEAVGFDHVPIQITLSHALLQQRYIALGAPAPINLRGIE